MRHDKLKILAGLVLAGTVSATSADPYFTGNPYTPYPPGCATQIDLQAGPDGNNAHRFFDGTVLLDLVRKADSPDPGENVGEARLELFRLACADNDRSMILARFRFHDVEYDPDYRLTQFVLPGFAGRLSEQDLVPFELQAEPNTWSAVAQQATFTRRAFGDFYSWEDPAQFTWWYVVDLGGAAAEYPGVDLASWYNDAFELVVFRDDAETLEVPVPATRDMVQSTPAMPLNGRLAGNWVERGTRDQGLLISFGNRVPAHGTSDSRPEDFDLVIFLSWFTFDANGGHLWLTGAAQFTQGASEVQIPIERVRGGTFMGATGAQRAVIGTARLRANHCNDLELDYDLAGAGSGSLRLERLYSLEIAGHPCRDQWTRAMTADPVSAGSQ